MTAISNTGLTVEYLRTPVEADSGYLSPLPLEPIDFDVVVSNILQQGMEFPSKAAQRKLWRMNLMDELFKGSLGSIYNEWLPSYRNYFKSVAAVYANELTAVAPKVEGQSASFNRYLYKAIYDAIVNLVKYGECVIYNDNGMIDSLDPRFFYETLEGWIMYEPYISQESEDGKPDKIKLTLYKDGDRSAEVTHWTYDSSLVVGSLLEVEEDIEVIPGDTIKVVRMPHNNRIFEDILPLVLDIAIALTGIKRVGRYHAKPIPVGRMSRQDVDELFNGESTDTFQERLQKSQKEMKGLFGEDSDGIIIPDEIQSYEFLVFDGKIPEMLNFIEKQESELYTIAGISSMEATAAKNQSSGIALKRQNSLEYNASSSILNGLKPALEELLQVMGIAGELEFNHPFDDINADMLDAQPQRETVGQ